MDVLEERLSGVLPDEPIFIRENVYRTVAVIDTGFHGAEDIPGTLALYPDRILYSRPDSADVVYPISEVSNVTLQFMTVLEFYHGDHKYRFKAKKPAFSAYMWVQAINLLINKNN